MTLKSKHIEPSNYCVGGGNVNKLQLHTGVATISTIGRTEVGDSISHLGAITKTKGKNVWMVLYEPFPGQAQTGAVNQ